MLMSVRTALAKLSAAAAGGALIGGAVHVAEPQAAETSYRSEKSVKTERPRYVKQERPVVPRRERTVRRVVERECCEEEQYAMVPIPLPQLPQQPIIATGG